MRCCIEREVEPIQDTGPTTREALAIQGRNRVLHEHERTAVAAREDIDGDGGLGSGIDGEGEREAPRRSDLQIASGVHGHPATAALDEPKPATRPRIDSDLADRAGSG